MTYRTNWGVLLVCYIDGLFRLTSYCSIRYYFIARGEFFDIVFSLVKIVLLLHLKDKWLTIFDKFPFLIASTRMIDSIVCLTKKVKMDKDILVAYTVISTLSKGVIVDTFCAWFGFFYKET